MTTTTPFLRELTKQREKIRKAREANEARARIPAAAIAAAAIHEASHAVAAVLAGGRITDLALTPHDPDHLGCCTYDGQLSAAAESQITLAGPYGEARHTYGARPSVRSIRSVLDGNCAADGTGDYDHLIASGEPLPFEVGRLIETTWPAIQTIARHLVAHDHADHATVCAALGVPETDAHLSAQASSIRAGLAPTPPKLPAGSPHSPARR
ncbi:hypothetical protein HBA53_00470 [Rhodococcus pyridinivorans]|uniref:M50 family metallopeptidase n=1 Tax=Rhodococcus pyridinivorans TaxID=103816 RepID=UPI001C3068F7|nr:M50 family metallopeptidase [Rhodococcus pyridinivorans]QXF79748.1 hypothetical protein HBA53_00470 [Rhodococcus pyridinivorans]